MIVEGRGERPVSGPRGGKRPTVTVFSSGKGGVGKTTVVANLAVALARQARRVMVLDADFGLANLDLAFGLSPERTLENVLEGDCRLADVAVTGPAGVTLIPSSSGRSDLAAMPQTLLAGLMEAVVDLAHGYDDLLLDTAAGISENVIGLFERADRLMVVLSPDPASLVDAYATIKLAHRRGFDRRLGVLVNGVRDEHEARESFGRLCRATERFLDLEPELVGHVPRDPSVVASLRAQRLVLEVYPDAPASLAFRRLAWKLEPGSCTGLTLPMSASVQ